MVVTAVNPKHYPRHPRLEMQQKFPELLTMSGAHYVTRTVTSKAFVRATRPLSQKLAYSSPLEEFNRYQGKKVRNVWLDKCAPHRVGGIILTLYFKKILGWYPCRAMRQEPISPQLFFV